MELFLHCNCFYSWHYALVQGYQLHISSAATIIIVMVVLFLSKVNCGEKVIRLVFLLIIMFWRNHSTKLLDITSQQPSRLRSHCCDNLNNSDIIAVDRRISFWLFRFDILMLYSLTNPSSEILAMVSWTGLRDHYLLSVIWWISYLWYSINKLICCYAFNCDWYESMICSTDFWALSI